MSKRQQVKDILLSWEHRVYTINYAHRMITGFDGAARWHEPLVECSKSTVKRALEELANEGKFEAYYRWGHCYDPKRYKRIEA